MKNMSQYKVEMPVQDPLVRNKNFEEVALGYTPEMAMEEAARCLGCKHRPCVEGCPVSVQIPDFIARVAEGDFAGAYRVIRQTTPCRLCAVVSAPRRASVRAGVSGASRENRWQSDGWSGSWRTGPGKISPVRKCLRPSTGIVWQ